MPTPSDDLKQALADLQLCSPEQLAACEPHVRRLTRDLPDFDSCWLDVLVARRVLTPWQADCLLSPNSAGMIQGRYRLREPLGDSTWLAETLDRKRLVVLRRLRGTSQQQTDQIVSRAVEVPETTGRFIQHDSPVCVPREVIDHSSGDGLWFVSPFVPGWRLDELLIRGGRLPWPVVAEIGRSLLAAQQSLQRDDLVHSNIVPRNIRLQSNGRAILVDPFSESLLRPTVGFRADLKLRDVQYCAPERIGTGRAHDAVSDLYSTGCVLWHLLTSRPTFLSADPVTFLMQARERDVDDVRNWVPDCPDWMAHQITALTRRSPELRPATVADALAGWSSQAGRGTGCTRRMLSRLPDRTTRSLVVAPTPPRRKSLIGAGAVAGIAGVALLGLSSGVIPLPLQLNREAMPATSASALTTSTEISEEAAIPTNQPIAFPDVSADGIITLLSGQRYIAAPRISAGTLEIRTTGTAAATVEVPAASAWNLKADQLQIRNVSIVRSASTTASKEPLTSLTCRVLYIDHCVVGSSPKSGSVPVFWQPAAEGSTIVRIANSVLRGGTAAIRTRRSPGRAELENVLIDHARSAWRCDAVSSLRLNLTRVTQLGGLSCLDAVPVNGTPVHIELSLGDSVLTPSDSLVRLASSDAQWQADRVQVAFRLPTRANPTVVLPSVNPAVFHDRSLGHMVALPEAQILSESLLLATPEFAASGSEGEFWSFARLTDFDGPKLGGRLPGVDVTQLPPIGPTSAPTVVQETTYVPRTQRSQHR